MPHRLASKAGRVLRRSRLRRPSVSVLVDARGATAEQVDRTLHGARAQGGPDLEILPFPAPSAEFEALLERHATEDWRVRRAGTPRGRHVLCVTAGDEPTADAVPTLLGLIDSAEAAVGGVESAGQARPAGVALPVEEGPQPPVDLVPAVLGRVLWRRDVWDQLPHEDPTTTYLTGLLRSGDVRTTTQPVVRRDEQAVAVFGAMPDPTPELAGWLDTVDRMDAALDGPATDVGSQKVTQASQNHYQHRRGDHAAWAVGVALEAERFLDAPERLDDAQWAALQERVHRAVEAAGGALMRLPVEARVKAWLAAHDRRSALEAFVRDRRLEDGQFPTTVDAGTVHAVLPGLPLDVPDWCLELTEAETPLRASLRSAQLTADGTLELRMFCLVDRVGPDGPPDTRIRLVGDERALDLEVTLETDAEATRFAGSRYHDHDHAAITARVPMGHLSEASGPATTDWRVEATTSVSGVLRSGLVGHHDPGAALHRFGGAVDGRPLRLVLDRHEPVLLRLGTGRPGIAPLHPDHPEHPEGRGPRLTDLDLRGDAVVVRGTAPGGTAAGATVRLVGPRATVAASARLEADSFEAEVPLRSDDWGLGDAPVPPGRYRIELGTGQDSTRLKRQAGAGPEARVGTLFRLHLRTAKDGGADLVLGPPLTDEELGPYRQQQLQRWYAETAPRKLPVARNRVYFQSYDGRSATDSPLAIYEELRRRPGAEKLDLVWAVADEHTWTPEGARRVLWRSQEWYAALATSARIVTSIELERWFRARPGQRVLQTFHGYPSKTMGIGLWRAKNFTDSRIEQQLRRTSRNWDLLLTPAPEMDRHYREQYRYDGEILAAGYPRDDALLAPDAGARRAATRERLGITEGQTVVLYAPTWRDDLAVNFRSARMGDHLDLPALAEALGPEYVVLVRGHRFHARGETARAGRSSRMVDVTDYPEINDLILAADATVLDYSSMRFDIALTGKPMVFLVPDLDEYTGGVRGFLYDFRDTAPGPLAQDQTEVVAALRDLDGVRTRYESAYRKFNETYNYRNDGHAAARVVDVFFRDLLPTS